MNKKIKVFIADYHALVRQGLKALLCEREDMEVVGESGRCSELMASLHKTRPEVLIMDPDMPGWNGLSVIGDLKDRLNLKVLVLTHKEDEETVLDAFHSGADGLCLKSTTFDEFSSAIRSIMHGKRYFSPELTGKLLRGFLNGGNGNGVKSQGLSLTRREKEILRLVGDGLGKKTLAEHLEISIKTVEKHVSNLMKKLNVHKFEGLVAYAVSKGISKG